MAFPPPPSYLNYRTQTLVACCCVGRLLVLRWVGLLVDIYSSTGLLPIIVDYCSGLPYLLVPQPCTRLLLCLFWLLVVILVVGSADTYFDLPAYTILQVLYCDYVPHPTPPPYLTYPPLHTRLMDCCRTARATHLPYRFVVFLLPDVHCIPTFYLLRTLL